jgi:hypothetical protein
MRNKGKTNMLCVSCEEEFIDGTDGDVVSVKCKEKKTEVAPAISLVPSIVDDDADDVESYEDFEFDDAPILPQFRSLTTEEDASSKIAKYILQVFTHSFHITQKAYIACNHA